MKINNAQLDVKEFMHNAGQELPLKPTMINGPLKELRLRLIREELSELEEALDKKDIVESYDALLDIMYVVIGTAISMGLTLEPGWEEVQKSNMSKFIDGYKRDDGKWQKGPSYFKPNLKVIIDDLNAQ